MKYQIEGWVLIKHGGQMRFSATHDTVTKETVLGKANRNTLYHFRSDFGSPTVEDFVGNESDEQSTNYNNKVKVARLTVQHYTSIEAPIWVQKALTNGLIFNVNKDDMKMLNGISCDFFLYFKPI